MVRMDGGERVTIGVPLYNGAATLRRCIDSLVIQTAPGCVIHIADDGSRDASREEARAIVAAYPQVKLTLHPTNLGPAGNFGFLLNAATTEYFMWLAADDWVAPDYVARMLAVLERRADVVCCVSRVRFGRDALERFGTGGYPLRHSVAENLAVFLSNPSDNTRQYGLYRRAALAASFPPRHFHAYDWAATAGTLRFGTHEEVAATLLFRDHTPTGEYLAAIARDNLRWFDRLFPLWPMTQELLHRQRIPLTWSIAMALAELNIHYLLTYAAYSAKRGRRPLDALRRFWDRHLGWRMKTRAWDIAPLDEADPRGSR